MPKLKLKKAEGIFKEDGCHLANPFLTTGLKIIFCGGGIEEEF
jgi:hypothetical protein